MPEIPPVIAAYFGTPPDAGADMLRAIFTDDAHVRDEAHDHVGIDAIRAWRVETYARTPFTVRPLEQRTAGHAVVVRAEVSGTFPGSPVMLDHRFELTGGRIASLDIG
ncbi:nuclear transport factor 2 family protein [Glacieibacterium frigidum]|uniref:Nuclear transport factor 2 family protein n=1 Tax=Glacieibacterium frigidum TaxID=2593303 RepID=A0A552U964_9SPHN|nr:nuclear transport factor 2 family protein [Glacieibacterium frigidum]TRW14755.1 nuclear transport factor 2 family protein [Glacieibacterium frigidum]